MNRVSEKYLETDGSFGERIPAIVEEVSARIGFSPEREIARGVLYEASKAGTAIVVGAYRDAPAILKLQGIKLEIEEADLMRQFTLLNDLARQEGGGTEKIRVPEVRLHERFQAARGYGLMVMERVSGLRIYSLPSTSPRERRRYAEFYAEFRRAVRQPFFLSKGGMTAPRFMERRLEGWLTMHQSARADRRLDPERLARLVTGYRAAIARFGQGLPMVFTHGHLGPRDVCVVGIDRYVLFSNAYWSWRPQWYDWAFNVWVDLMAAGTERAPSPKAFLQIAQEWREAAAAVPQIAADQAFDARYRLMLLERCVGSLLVDVPLADRAPAAEVHRIGHREAFWELARHLLQELGERVRF